MDVTSPGEARIAWLTIVLVGCRRMVRRMLNPPGEARIA